MQSSSIIFIRVYLLFFRLSPNLSQCQESFLLESERLRKVNWLKEVYFLEQSAEVITRWGLAPELDQTGIVASCWPSSEESLFIRLALDALPDLLHPFDLQTVSFAAYLYFFHFTSGSAERKIYLAMRELTCFYINQIPLTIASGHSLAAEACEVAASEALTEHRRYCTDWTKLAEDSERAESASPKLDKVLEISRFWWMDGASTHGAYAYQYCHPYWRATAQLAWWYDCGRPSTSYAAESDALYSRFLSEWNKVAIEYLALVNEAAGHLIQIQKMYSAANGAGKRAEEKAEAAEKREREALTKEFERQARKLGEAERKAEERREAVRSNALGKGSTEGRGKLVGEEGGNNELTKAVGKEVASQNLEEQGSSLGVQKNKQKKAVAQKGGVLIPVEETRPSENQADGKQQPGRMDGRQKVSFLSAND